MDESNKLARIQSSAISKRPEKTSLEAVGPREAIEGEKMLITPKVEIVRILSALVAMVNKRLSFRSKLDASQIVETARAIFGKYPTGSIEDVTLCFKMALNGDLKSSKKLFRLDQQIIMNWLNDYFTQRDIWEEDARKQSAREDTPVLVRPLAVVNGKTKTFADLLRDCEAAVMVLRIEEKRALIEQTNKTIKQAADVHKSLKK